MTKEERIAKARDLFMQGYNCSQSVTAAFADLYGIDKQVALKISASFGGGIGRMRQTCGAACGMFILAGLETGTTDPTNRMGKAKNYKAVQYLANKFKEENGSLCCGDLLGLKKSEPNQDTTPEQRTKEYYKKRPCPDIVAIAAKIFADYLKEKNDFKS